MPSPSRHDHWAPLPVPGTGVKAAAARWDHPGGVARSSVIRLLEDQEFKVVEKNITLEAVVARVWDGLIVAVSACGTAPVGTPVGRLASDGINVAIGSGEACAVTMGVRKILTDIQYGRAERTYGWMRRVD